jgi:hypothetical protein
VATYDSDNEPTTTTRWRSERHVISRHTTTPTKSPIHGPGKKLEVEKFKFEASTVASWKHATTAATTHEKEEERLID